MTLFFFYLSRIILFHLTRAVSLPPPPLFVSIRLSFPLSIYSISRSLLFLLFPQFPHSPFSFFLWTTFLSFAPSLFPYFMAFPPLSDSASLSLALIACSFFFFVPLFHPNLFPSFVDFLVCLSGSLHVFSLLFLSRIRPLPPWICLPGGAPSSSILGDEYVALLDAEARAG